MSERCPLSSGIAPGFSYGGEFPAVCNRVCEKLWDLAVRNGGGDFESYADAGIIEDVDCEHPSAEYSHDALQAVKVGLATRLYTTVDYCPSCETEVSETSFTFQCPIA